MSGKDWYSTENLTKILNKIHGIIHEYESGAYLSPDKLVEAQRLLSSNIYYLSVFQIEFKKRWNTEVHRLSKETSNAAAKAEADELTPELYVCRKIIETAGRVCVSMSQELKIISRE